MSTAVAKADRCVRPLKADSVSPLPRQEADPRRGGLAGQGQLSATLGKLRYRPIAVLRGPRSNDRNRLRAAGKD